MERAIFAAGCFWGVEETFRNLPGVSKTTVGYIGGHLPNPTYETICRGGTGHAEAVEVEFDADEISYDQLLNAFWTAHDPTTVNRQGPDVGEQYRSAIFCVNPEQEKRASASKEQLDRSGKLGKPVATQIVTAPTFYRAEDYHQQYLAKQGIKVCH